MVQNLLKWKKLRVDEDPFPSPTFVPRERFFLLVTEVLVWILHQDERGT